MKVLDIDTNPPFALVIVQNWFEELKAKVPVRSRWPVFAETRLPSRDRKARIPANLWVRVGGAKRGCDSAKLLGAVKGLVGIR
jgi:hypothetical protein